MTFNYQLFVAKVAKYVTNIVFLQSLNHEYLLSVDKYAAEVVAFRGP